MNEKEFVSYLKREFPFSYGIGIGDDASVSSPTGEKMLVTNDILAEGIHFQRDYFDMGELALKSLGVNVSDITAMGGVPKYYYLGLGFPSEFSRDHLEAFFDGLKEGNGMWGTELAGGDFSRSSGIFISITLIGETGNPVLRSGAREGDLIGISGPVGESALGLEQLKMGIRSGYFVQKHKRVAPDIRKGVVLSKYVSGMIDISDGLVIDTNRILEASGCGGLIEYDRIPVSEDMKKTCRDAHLKEEELVLAGGEDYVLLFTVSPDNEEKLREEGIEYCIIGDVKSRDFGLKVQRGDVPVVLSSPGYDHFE